ncbi:MAG: PP2C family protein-serine/threonine phosphatase [Planctomycetaceae bacterium]
MGSQSSLDHHDVTHVGLRRSNNQDAKGVVVPWNREQYRRRGWLFIVADGMGAHAAGEMASALAVQEVTGAYEKLAARSPPLALRTSIEDANAKIFARGETSPDLKGMGTTCTALVIVPRGALVGHVGDSRAYRVRGGTIEQLSRDHSLVWDLEEQAGGRDSVVPAGVPKNIITRSMGPHAKVKVDVEGPFPVEPDDVYVLCSDGLSGQVADEEIGLLAAALPPKAAAEALVGLALARGAPDNVTVIVAKAGPREKSRVSATDLPWPLEEDDAGSARPGLPWRMLVIAAASLLLGLMINPWSRLVASGDETGIVCDLLGKDLGQAVAMAVGVVMLLAFVGSLLAAVLGFLVPAGGGGRVLRSDQRIGGGPYRTYDCRPTDDLVEGIAASVEAAADGLDGKQRQTCVAPLAAARSAAATGDFTASVTAVAAALAGFRRAVDSRG